MLLAIDTSTTQIGIACYDAGGVLGEVQWQSGRNQTTQLLPQLDLLLAHLERSPADIEAIAVALGPGSWSGLRVGLSTAKGLAIARDLPLIGIGTLDLLAYQHYRPGLPVCPLIRLGRDRVATAIFTDAPAAPYVSAGRNLTLAELAGTVQGRTLFCGDLDADIRTALEPVFGSDARFPTGAANVRRAGFLAELGWQRWQAGTIDDRAALEPIYLGQAVKTPPTP